MSQFLILLGITGIFLISSLDWRKSVKVALIIVLLEGVLRKWVLPQASDLIYFLKDIVLFGAYSRFYLSSERKYPFRINSITIPLLLSILWCVLMAFTPSLGSPIIGLFGLKAYFYYIPLMWILPNLFKSINEIYHYLRHFLLWTLPICSLAIIQFFSPASSFLNVYAGGEEATAGFGSSGFIRVTGTFPYISGYTIYLSVCFALLLPLLLLPQNRLWRWLTILELILVVGTSFMTGARGLILCEILFIIGYLIVPSLSRKFRISKMLKQLVFPILIIAIIVPQFFGQAIGAFSNRFVNSSPETFVNRIFEPFSEPATAIQFKGLDGFGTGATHQATNSLRRVLGLSLGEPLPPSEGEMGRIMMEIGPIGFLFWYGLRVALIVELWRMFARNKSIFLHHLTFSTLLFHIIFFTSHLVFNHIFSIYFWFLSGFLFLLPRLDKKSLPSSNSITPS